MKALSALAFLCSAALFGQGTTATISGNVTDNSGAVIAAVTVTATNLETNVSRTVQSLADGSYALQFLPIGTYRVSVSNPGFKKFEQTGIVLDVNRNARVDAILQVGAISETVEVKADAAMVETAQPGLGSTVNNQDIENLPLVNRDIYSLLTLTAGVDDTLAATDNFGAPMQVTFINGSPNSGIGSVNYNLDGGSNTNGLRNTGNAAPNPDAVQEFRVTTNSYPADEGRFGGGSVTMVTKSGTNRLTGSLFEFIRNDKLNANRWLPGQTILSKDPLHRNQFGGTAGGPIIKNKTFIFGSYSGLRERTSIFQNTATPLTAAERLGDLSLSGGTAPVDPLNGLAFPGRQIPVTRIDPVIKKINDTYIPLPNLAAGRYEVQLPHPKDTDELQTKIDHNLNAAHHLTGSFFYTTGIDDVGLIGNLNWVDRKFHFAQYNYNAKETWIVSPTKINEFRIAYIRNFGGRTIYPQIGLEDLGSKYVTQGPRSLPQISVSGRFNLTSALAGNMTGSNQYQVRDLFSIVTSRHNLRIGAELTLEKMIHDAQLQNYGAFSFNTNNTRGTKNATGDWLLGLPVTMNQDAPTIKINNSWYIASYIQDDFRVTSRLTLNLGARWDIQTPITDPLDRFLTFIPNVQSKVVPTAPIGLLFPGDTGVERGIIKTKFKNLSPRFGMAWDPFGDRKTAIRAAAGIFYGSMSGNEWNTSSDNQPFAIRQQFTNAYSISDPYRLMPGGVSPFPYSYSPKNPKFVPPSAIVAIGLDYKSPYTYQMNVAIQRQVTKDTSITVAYVNNLTHRIPVSPDVNYPVLKAGATVANLNDRRPYLTNVLSSISVTKSILNSAYHGLQITGDKRLSANFSLKGFYTFGKGLDYINTQNSTQQVATDWNNIALDRARTNNDRAHNVVISGIWDLKYFNNTPRAVKIVAKGWSISAISSFRSGTPLNITTGTDGNFDGTTNDRPDLIGNPKLDANRPRNEVVDKWFDATAFTRTTQVIHNYAGTSGRNILDAPGLKNVDMGLFREFRITERKRFQFRAESTNALNLVNLSNPGTNLGTTSTLGKITTGRAMRQVQMALKLYF